MQIQHQITVGTMKWHDERFPELKLSIVVGKRLQCIHVAYPQLISGVLERHDVMGIAGYTFGISAHGKHVLAQIQHRHPLMMRMFGE